MRIFRAVAKNKKPLNTYCLKAFFMSLGQNLVFKALFGSVSDDKYFFAIVMKSVVDDKHWLL